MADHLNSARSHLVVVDVQDRLLAAMPRAGELLQNVGFVIDVAKLLDVPVAATEQYPQGLGPTEAGIAAKLIDAIAAKTRFSCYGAPGFAASLGMSGRRQVVLAGMESHVCILQTALDLIAEGYTVFIPVDAVQSRFEIDHATALRRMESVGAILTTVEAVAFEWLGDAKHPQFKAVSKLVRERTTITAR